jgi:hypothetical protein
MATSYCDWLVEQIVSSRFKHRMENYHPYYVFLVCQVEEIQDTDNDESEEDYASSQAQAARLTATPVRWLRQRSLLELFKPQHKLDRTDSYGIQ